MPKIFDSEKEIKIPPVTMPEILISIMDDYCQAKGIKRNELIRHSRVSQKRLPIWQTTGS
jgi:hypothetical protein